MLAFYCDGENVKKLMQIILSSAAFDNFELRTADIVTRAGFSIDGRRNKEFDADKTSDFCYWGEIRQNVYDLIKGKKLPKHIKLVFALNSIDVERLHPNAKAAFLNIVFESGKITFTTGCAQKEFSLDKGLDDVWESCVKDMFKRLGISINIL